MLLLYNIIIVETSCTVSLQMTEYSSPLCPEQNYDLSRWRVLVPGNTLSSFMSFQLPPLFATPAILSEIFVPFLAVTNENLS